MPHDYLRAYVCVVGVAVACILLGQGKDEGGALGRSSIRMRLRVRLLADRHFGEPALVVQSNNCRIEVPFNRAVRFARLDR